MLTPQRRFAESRRSRSAMILSRESIPSASAWTCCLASRRSSSIWRRRELLRSAASCRSAATALSVSRRAPFSLFTNWNHSWMSRPDMEFITVLCPSLSATRRLLGVRYGEPGPSKQPTRVTSTLSTYCGRRRDLRYMVIRSHGMRGSPWANSHCSHVPKLTLKKHSRCTARRRACRNRLPAAAHRKPIHFPCLTTSRWHRRSSVDTPASPASKTMYFCPGWASFGTSCTEYGTPSGPRKQTTSPVSSPGRLPASLLKGACLGITYSPRGEPSA
mmetsp:Transcript_42948/g.101972  ORF Transcript_42948/g.101972 Transcript_42948/m.101972 type:complete len:274 (-) Transcript_42948:490-1311(-)